MIRELHYRDKRLPTYMGKDGRGPYDVNGGLPWYHETGPCNSQEEAWHAAIAWAAAYRAADTMGNMAHAHGVISTVEGWHGVVNYYHSNT